MLNNKIIKLMMACILCASMVGIVTSASAATTPPHFNFNLSELTPSQKAAVAEWTRESGPIMKTIYEVSGRPKETVTLHVVDGAEDSFQSWNAQVTVVEREGHLVLSEFVHEVGGHAIRIGRTISNQVFEEGLARAAERETMYRLAGKDITEAGYDQNHNDGYEMYLDNVNVVGLGIPYGFIGADPALVLERYDIAGYDFGKIEIENPQFIAGMNAQVFKYAEGSFTPEQLVKMMAAVQPTVEGQPTATWVHSQHIFDTQIEPGCRVLMRVNQYTVDAFCTDSEGHVQMQAGVPASLEVRGPSKELLYKGSEITTGYGWGQFYPQIAAGVGRLQLVASAVIGGKTYSTTYYRQSGPEEGVFGAVTGALTGYLRLSSPKGQFATQYAAVKKGAFEVPNLTKIRGQVVIEFSGEGRTARKVFDKDAAPISEVLTAK